MTETPELAKTVKKNKDAVRAQTGVMVEAMLAAPLIREAWAAAIEAGATAAATVLRRREPEPAVAPETEPTPEKDPKKRRKIGGKAPTAEAVG